MTTTEETRRPSVLAALRAQVPTRPLTPWETRNVLDRQATLLLELTDAAGPAVAIEAIAAALPRVLVRAGANLPFSGRTRWNGNSWVLLVDADEAKVRQRFSLAHEIAHVIWHPLAANTLPDTAKTLAADRLEHACDYFASCLLMPHLWLKRAYFDGGIQDVPSLARLFNVSWPAMRVRLEQLGFTTALKAESTQEAA